MQVLSFAALVVSLFLVAVQTRRLGKQVEIANKFSTYESFSSAAERYDAGLALLYQSPHLRPYFFEGKALDLDADDLNRALVIADMMAGALSNALTVGEQFPDGTRQGWHRLATAMGRNPLFQMVLDEQPYSFTKLREHLGER
ncbi:hypothetical protein [Actinoplanes sp. OR16]|uniref:hypothetical protein n=1 Tax=Actinoplanes sp. OR16 TaxID=946334 RepID=UPI000FD8D9C1|nr:hypothetical protein [Actinoplanes sp. OR16]